MKLAAILIFVIGFLPACSASLSAGSPRASANGETLIGLWEGDDGRIAAFKGIPFAAPPVGALRWRAPQPHQPRPGEQPAHNFAAACMQGEHMTRWYEGVARDFGADPGGVGKFNGVSEDCLYLNVWTPALSANARLPVIVWVHGGSNAGGWSYEPNYVGDRLAAQGAVVVTVSYRVGPFGFFSHPSLQNEPGAPIANFGWLDILAAAQWVKRHITGFGGNPDNVTLMGESSGAANILDFVVQESAAQSGFDRVILQSTPNRFGPRRNVLQAMEAGERLIDFLGVDAASLTADQLRALTAQDLLSAADAMETNAYYDIVKDGVTFTRTPSQALGTERLAELDVLIGSNADEWLMYLDQTTRGFDVDHWLYENARGSSATLRRLAETDQNPRKALDRLETARKMACPSRYLAERVTAAGGRAWVYWFSRQRPGPGGERLGAYHGTEIGYVFDQHEYWQAVDARDRELTRAVMDYWVAFARSGDPNFSDRPGWPMYRAARPEVLELGDEIRVIPPPDQDLCLWLGPGVSALP
jgi:para-nitrobenzyl esterase